VFRPLQTGQEAQQAAGLCRRADLRTEVLKTSLPEWPLFLRFFIV